jgi:hypothetical protein
MRWISTVGAIALAFTAGLVVGHAAPSREAFAAGREAAAESAEGPHSHEVLYREGFAAGERAEALRFLRACEDVLAEDEAEAGAGVGWCDSIADRAIDIADAEGGAR